jgi:hypothetical protein
LLFRLQPLQTIASDSQLPRLRADIKRISAEFQISPVRAARVQFRRAVIAARVADVKALVQPPPDGSVRRHLDGKPGGS